MCTQCGYENGSTKHLLYWQSEWFKRFITTWWHIINRKAYWKWYFKTKIKPKKISNISIDINEGLRFELDEVLRDLN